MQPTNETISYYQGDDFSIIVYPKDSTGKPIPIAGDTGFFKIASARGPSPAAMVTTTVAIQTTGGSDYAVVGSVSSINGSNIKNGYVYDLGYIKGGKRVTILTGTFSVVDRVYP